MAATNITRVPVSSLALVALSKQMKRRVIIDGNTRHADKANGGGRLMSKNLDRIFPLEKSCVRACYSVVRISVKRATQSFNIIQRRT